MFKYRIRQHERGLWFRYGDFKGLLAPGKYRLWSRLWSRTRNTINIVDTLKFQFEHPLLDMLLKNEQLREALVVVDLSDHQRALVWKDNRLANILGPGRFAFWKEPYDVKVEVFDVNEFKFDHPRLETVLGHRGGALYLDGVRVEAHERVLLFREGVLVETLGPGMYVFWKNAGKITWKSVDLREQTLDVSGQEIMTRDKVTLRVNLLVTYLVLDVEKAVLAVSDYAQTLYRESQLALRAAVGTRNLDTMLSDKESVGNDVREALTRRAEEFGIAVRGVGLRDIILPGEMKQILNQVIEAEKQAQANLIRRREETAAARSQANTAKLLAENPALTRMKELEALQEILRGTKATFVLGQGDLVEQVSRLTAKDVSNGES